MNIEEKAKEELLEAAENIDGADAFVLLIGYEDEHALSTIVGRAGDVLSLLVKALNHALSCHPSKEEKDLRMKIAQIILGGANDAAR